MKHSRNLLLCKVVRIPVQQSICYPACPQCNSKLYQNSDRWHCLKCQQHFQHPHMRYRLCLTVTDGQTLADVTVFGTHLEPIVGCTADQFHSDSRRLFNSSLPVDQLLQAALSQAFIGNCYMFGFKFNWKASSAKTLSAIAQHQPVTNFSQQSQSHASSHPSLTAWQIFTADGSLPPTTLLLTLKSLIHSSQQSSNNNEDVAVESEKLFRRHSEIKSFLKSFARDELSFDDSSRMSSHSKRWDNGQKSLALSCDETEESKLLAYEESSVMEKSDNVSSHSRFSMIHDQSVEKARNCSTMLDRISPPVDISLVNMDSSHQNSLCKIGEDSIEQDIKSAMQLAMDMDENMTLSQDFDAKIFEPQEFDVLCSQSQEKVKRQSKSCDQSLNETIDSRFEGHHLENRLVSKYISCSNERDSSVLHQSLDETFDTRFEAAKEEANCVLTESFLSPEGDSCQKTNGVPVVKNSVKFFRTRKDFATIGIHCDFLESSGESSGFRSSGLTQSLKKTQSQTQSGYSSSSKSQSQTQSGSSKITSPDCADSDKDVLVCSETPSVDLKRPGKCLSTIVEEVTGDFSSIQSLTSNDFPTMKNVDVKHGLNNTLSQDVDENISSDGSDSDESYCLLAGSGRTKDLHTQAYEHGEQNRHCLSIQLPRSNENKRNGCVDITDVQLDTQASQMVVFVDTEEQWSDMPESEAIDALLQDISHSQGFEQFDRRKEAENKTYGDTEPSLHVSIESGQLDEKSEAICEMVSVQMNSSEKVVKSDEVIASKGANDRTINQELEQEKSNEWSDMPDSEGLEAFLHNSTASQVNQSPLNRDNPMTNADSVKENGISKTDESEHHSAVNDNEEISQVPESEGLDALLNDSSFTSVNEQEDPKPDLSKDSIPKEEEVKMTEKADIVSEKKSFDDSEDVFHSDASMDLFDASMDLISGSDGSDVEDSNGCNTETNKSSRETVVREDITEATNCNVNKSWKLGRRKSSDINPSLKLLKTAVSQSHRKRRQSSIMKENNLASVDGSSMDSPSPLLLKHLHKAKKKKRGKSVIFASRLCKEEIIADIDYKMCTTPSPGLLKIKRKSCLKSNSSTPREKTQTPVRSHKSPQLKAVSTDGENLMPNSEELFTPSPIVIPRSVISERIKSRNSEQIAQSTPTSARRFSHKSANDTEDIIPCSMATPLLQNRIQFKKPRTPNRESDIELSQDSSQPSFISDTGEYSASGCLFSDSDGSLFSNMSQESKSCSQRSIIRKNSQPLVGEVLGTSQGIETSLSVMEGSCDLFSEASCLGDSLHGEISICKKLKY